MRFAASPNSSAVVVSPVDFSAADGFALRGTWFVPAENAPLEQVVVIACGAGIPARFYWRMAKFVAGYGISVLTFDYRGIGESRHGSLAGLNAGIESWAELDFGSALATARTSFPTAQLGVIAHSFGAMLIGAAPDASKITRMVLFGPHTGYWRDYGTRWRNLLHFTWHVFMPIVTKGVGFFPGRLFRLGEDLPRKFALDWAGRRRPDLVRTNDDQRRFGQILARFGETRAISLALSVTDDAFAPPAAGRRLFAMYPNIVTAHEAITPEALGFSRLGHMAFLRRNSGQYFWERAAAWFLQSGTDGRASASGVLSDVPPSGMKGPTSAGSATLS